VKAVLFNLSLSLSVISTNLAQPCCKKCTSLSFVCPIKENDHRHVLGFGFRSCGILVFGWIWILLFLFKQNWIGIDDILLYFVTFGSVLGLQVIVLIIVSQIH